MERVVFILMLLCMPSLARAQQKQVLSVAAASCTTTGTSCLINSVDSGVGGMTFTVTANASSNTLQFEASGDGGTTWVALNVTPSNSSTAVSSTTSTGTWQANVAGYTNVRIRMSTLSGGTSTVSIISSFASARAGGGGGGTVSSISATGPIVVTPSPITGTGTISCATCLTSSSTVPMNNVVSATGAIATIADGDNPLVINCALVAGSSCLTVGETAAGTSGGPLLSLNTATTSNSPTLQIAQGANGPAGGAAPFVIFVSAAAAGGIPAVSSAGTAGAGINLKTGAGSPGGVTTGNGGNGGLYVLSTGSGGAAGGTTTNAGGNGGNWQTTLGNGAAGAATGNGGNGGVYNLCTTSCGGGTGGATSGTGGAGSDININGGPGGNATAGSTTGRGGNITLTPGPAGTIGTAGVPGQLKILGPPVSGGNTTSLFNATQTWNTTGVVDAAIFLNITNTASGAGSKLMDLKVGATPEFTVDVAGNVLVNNSLTANGNVAAATFNTATNCTSSASPAVCGSAGAGTVVVAAGATTVQVNTTAVTANSEVLIQYDSSLGTKLGVTCNVTVALPAVTARAGGTSFTITVPAAPSVNPACYSYSILN